MVSLTQIPRKVTLGYTLKSKENLSHLFNINGLKIFGKIEHEINSLRSKVQTFVKDIGVEFSIKKVCCVLYCHLMVQN